MLLKISSSVCKHFRNEYPSDSNPILLISKYTFVKQQRILVGGNLRLYDMLLTLLLLLIWMSIYLRLSIMPACFNIVGLCHYMVWYYALAVRQGRLLTHIFLPKYQHVPFRSIHPLKQKVTVKIKRLPQNKQTIQKDLTSLVPAPLTA